MQPETPQKQHEWLTRLAGEWTYESLGPDKCGGAETVRSIGGLWIVGESTGKMPDGGEARMFITLGFDPVTNRYIGTWIGSMATKLWIYDGELDAAGKVLTLSAVGPDWTDPAKSVNYHDIIEILDEDRRLLRSEMEQPDGTWKEFMRMEYRRKA